MAELLQQHGLDLFGSGAGQPAFIEQDQLSSAWGLAGVSATQALHL